MLCRIVGEANVVPEYPAWEIERKATQLVADSHAGGFPESYVDIEWIIESFLGLELVPIPGLRTGWNIDGVICRRPDQTYCIVVDEDALDHSHHRSRFTLGEEVGHYVLHAKHLPLASTVEEALAAYRSLTNWSRLDRNARRFAAAVLMPMRTLVRNAEKVYAELVQTVGLRDPQAIRKYLVSLLAKSYVVSMDAMRFRLKEYPAHLDRRVEQALKEQLTTLP